MCGYGTPHKHRLAFFLSFVLRCIETKLRLRPPQNNLIESASHATGSLLIWDTGEYDVLDRHKRAAETDDDLSDVSDREMVDPASGNERLVQAFQSVREGPPCSLNHVVFYLL